MPFGGSSVMIVQSLARYYDILAADKSAKISKLGYSPANVSFALVISEKGELTNIIDLRTDGKKKTPKSIEVPYQKSRAVAVIPFFACDNAKYIFGIEKISNDGKKEEKGGILNVLEDFGNGSIVVSRRSIECFEHSRLFHHRILDKMDDPGVIAFLKFLDSWKPEDSLGHPKIAEFKEEILSGGMFVFDLNGTYLHDNPEARKTWETLSSGDNEENGQPLSQCLVSGKIEPIARTHQKIKRVLGAQSAGATLVGFNDSSFESYGKIQSYNAPISEGAMFKYTTVLNHLLERGSKNRIQIGDTTTVFWAETTKESCGDLASYLIDPAEAIESEDESSKESSCKDIATRQMVSDILGKVRSGEYLREKDLGVDPETTKFYILGLSPNNARLAVRFWHEDSFGNFITRVARHHLDMEIERDERRARLTSMSRLLKQTVSEGSKDLAASPMHGGLLMRAILENTPYPVPLYGAILKRVKVERSINSTRAGFIKACLIRLARMRGNHEEDMITVSLNEESQNVPYRLGRLFAVLEKAQSDTNRELKSTINSKYFSSASTTPAGVFPVLLKLAQHHIAKSDWGFRSDQAIQEIMSGIDGFPKTLTLEEQGMFIIGYYHQRKANYRKKEDSEEKTKAQMEE
jgi:CRISPR-associated protein Csd1